MDLLISFGLLAVGGIIGFFVARFMYLENRDSAAGKAAAADVKAVMTQQAEHYVFQTKQTLHSMQQQIEVLSEQLESYESQLQPQEEDNDLPKMSFFGGLFIDEKMRSNEPKQ